MSCHVLRAQLTLFMCQISVKCVMIFTRFSFQIQMLDIEMRNSH